MSHGSTAPNLSTCVATTNIGKLREIESFLGPVTGINIDIPEIQSTDGAEVARQKLLYVLTMDPLQKCQVGIHPGPVLVEDTGLSIDGMGALPGPLIKWFLSEMDLPKIAELAGAIGSRCATARTFLAWGKSQHNVTSSTSLVTTKDPVTVTGENDIIITCGITTGHIVAPRGLNGFGWDAIFQPDGSNKTFAEMSLEEKRQYSMREKALTMLSDILRMKQ